MPNLARQSPTHRMTVEEFLHWEEGREGRHELIDGEIVEMQAERNAHALVKSNVFLALRSGIARAGVPCRAWMDGVSVRIDDHTKFEPDAAVACTQFDPDSVLISDPVIVVEVTSPSTQRLDVTRKLSRYFRAPSIQHYLIVLMEERVVIHHQRNGDEIASRIVTGGEISLDPPGMVLAVADLFADLPEGEEALSQTSAAP